MKTYKPRKLTTKQKLFIKEKLDNPKQSDTQAAIKAYSTPDKQISPASAQVIAFENLRKPAITSKLEDANELVESALIGTVKDWGDHDKPRQREIALDSAKYIHDKVHGRATQSIETKSTQVVVNIDLTKPDNPPEPLEEAKE